MRIGLLGAHRTGKTTLAKAVSERLGIAFLPTSVSGIAANYEFDMDLDRRDDDVFFKMQKDILDHIEGNVKGGADFVTDRTPLDAAAYLMGDIQASTGTPGFQDEVLQYVDSAVRMTNDLFDVVILLPPAIEFDHMDGKPGANLAYQEHNHLLCAGLSNQLTIWNGEIERDNMKLGDRVDAVEAFVKDRGTDPWRETEDAP